MTSAVLAPAESAFQPQTATAPPRKRRRRTAAGGATDDCFTCSKRSVKCDRKRPYCTQCIEIGKECSGYKTTLTWGVGVASRGKLRGMSCPVSNQEVAASGSPPETEHRRRKSSVSRIKTENDRGAHASRQVPLSQLPPITQGREQPALAPTLPMPVPGPHTQWQDCGFGAQPSGRRDSTQHGSFQLPPLSQIRTSFNGQFDFGGLPVTATSMGSYAESDYHSPPDFPCTPSSLHFPDPMHRSGYTEQPVNDNLSIGGVPTLEGKVESEQMEERNNAFNEGSMNAMSTTLYDGNSLGFDDFDFNEHLDEHSLALFDSRFSNPFFHLPSRLQSLMNYYDQNICPFLVAFDGDQNPYRKHILQLAIDNEGLQNAIAALSTNNMRMRRKERETGGFICELPDGHETEMVSDEEALYKQSSIDHLNVQLSNPMCARSDSVLATLLILCLFHVCDSGFSKFRTQLAGVQKLLSLRSPAQLEQNSREFTQWVEMFFAWFDVMTSAVNDREMQIKGESLDMLDFSANLGALEQFSGCDGRLFKLIARLSRLNLLAQGRPVRPSNPSGSPPHRAATNNVPTMRRAKKSLSPIDYENVDGNGWGTPIFSSDEDVDGSKSDARPKLPDERQEFWQEWNEVRFHLQDWQMDTSVTPPTTDSLQLDAGQRDLVHINESFRYSALLYTERLGNPVLPSSHPQFQELVGRALYHITAIPVSSCVTKFLLWPLFIIGTECVDAGHRNMIRSRCIDIQKESGFFNNISGLEVLEKVWKEYPASNGSYSSAEADEEEVKRRRRDSVVTSGRGYGQAFRWRKAMERKDGEYIVI